MNNIYSNLERKRAGILKYSGKIVLLIVFFFTAISSFAQTNILAKWYDAPVGKTIPANIIEPKITATANASAKINIININQNNGNVFYETNSWPTPKNDGTIAVLDEAKYLQFTVSPQNTYQIKNIKFNFTARAGGSDETQYMEVKFSTDPSFTKSNVLLGKTALPQNSAYGAYNLGFPKGFSIEPGQTVYIRIYVYNTNQVFQIKHDLTGVDCPNISGDVTLVNPLIPVPKDDLAGVLQNDVNPTPIDILVNDEYRYSGPLTSINVTPAQHGTVTVNATNNVTYLPASGYSGYDRFTYTLTNAVGTSSSAKVELQVLPLSTSKALVRWNKNDFNATSYDSGVVGSLLTSSVRALTLKADTSTFIWAGSFPSPQELDSYLDPNKYLEMSIGATGDNISYLQQFIIKSKSTGEGKMTLKYSKTADFSGSVLTLFDKVNITSSLIETSSNFPIGTVIYPGEKLYLRLYVYNTYQGTFQIDFSQNGSSGPSITGVTAKVVQPPVCQTVGAASSNPIVCNNTVMTTVKIATANATGIGTPSNLPDGIKATFGSNTVTISGTPTASGTFNYSIPILGGCAAIMAVGTITVNNAPSISAVTEPAALCAGSSLNPTAPTVAANGSTITSSGWQLETGVPGFFSNITIPYIVAFGDNGKKVRYYATNNCGTSYTNEVVLKVNNLPTIEAVTEPAALCAGSSLNPTTPTVAANGSRVTSSGWQLETDIKSGEFSNISVPYPIAFGDNGKKIRFYATNSCGTSYSNEVVLRVNNLPTISEITAPAPLRAGSSLNPATPTVVANGSTITAAGWQLETGVGTNSYVPINVPYTVALGDNGKKIRYSAANSCGSTTSKSFDLVVNPILAASVNITTPTNFICPGSSVLLTFASQVINQGSSPTYQWQLNGVDLPGETSSTLSSSALVVGDRVKLRMTSNANPCLSDSQVSSNEILIATQTAVYNGGWVINPAANLSAEIRSAYDLAVNVEACKLLVTNNAPVTIKTGHYFKIQNGITVDNGSILKVESDANLIQNNDAAINTGNITAERDIKIGTIRAQYNYFGSPVAFEATQSYKTIYPGITNVLLYNQATNYFVNSSGVNIPGRGLALKEPTPATPINGSKITAQYKGVPQNGEIILGIANKDIDSNTFGFNLIGNPYPSNIDLRKLYDINGGNTDVPQFESRSISPTFYFWDNNNNEEFNQQGSGYDGQSYAIFNVLSGSNGTGTEAGSLSGALIGSKKPTKIVKVGQGFMTRSLRDTYDFKFNNSIRTVATSIFDFLGKESSNKEDDRYWLKMIAPSGISSTIAIVHYPGGNDSFGLEDSESMGGSDALYSIVENKKVAINGRSNFKSQDVVPLGTKHFALGNYTIALDSPEGIFGSGQSIYLKDKQAGIITDLSKGNYSFSIAKGENTGRFEIIYKPETVLATDSKTKEQLMVYKDGSDFVVKSQSKNITGLEVYDATGRLITQLQPNQTKVIIPAESLVNGVYILKINQNGVITSKKIIK